MEKLANKTNFKSSGKGKWEGWMYPSIFSMDVIKVVVTKWRPVNVVAAAGKAKSYLKVYKKLSKSIIMYLLGQDC